MTSTEQKTDGALLDKFAAYLKEFDGSDTLPNSAFTADAEMLLRMAREHFAAFPPVSREGEEAHADMLAEALKYCRDMAINGMASHRDCIVGQCDQALTSHQERRKD